MGYYLSGRRFWTTTLPMALLFLAGLSVLGMLAYAGRERALSGWNDFLPFYAGGRLAFSGHLYDQARIMEEERRVTGVFGENLHFIRPPWFAAALWPIAQMNFSAAHVVWELLAVGALVVFCFYWLPDKRVASIAATCCSVPALTSLMSGQDTPLLLLWMVLGAVLIRRNLLFSAGLVLALCQTKFHIFLPLWVILMAGGHWRLLRGMAAGHAGLALWGAAVAGWRWPLDYLASIRNDAVTPGTEHMPTIYWAAYDLGFRGTAYVAFAVIAIAVAAWFIGKRCDLLTGLAAAPALAMPFLQHTYIYDAVLLLPLLTLAMQLPSPRLCAMVFPLLTPIPWVACLVGQPWSLVAPGFVIALIALRLTFKGSPAESAPAPMPELAQAS